MEKKISLIIILIADILAAIECYRSFGWFSALGWIIAAGWTSIEWFECRHYEKTTKELLDIIEAMEIVCGKSKPEEASSVQAPQA